MRLKGGRSGQRRGWVESRTFWRYFGVRGVSLSLTYFQDRLVVGDDERSIKLFL